MMIMHTSYVDNVLVGKSREQAIKEIKSLWKEIRRLKKIIEENPDSIEMKTCPNPIVKIGAYRDCIETAKEYFKSQGWDYEMCREEISGKVFNDQLHDIQSITVKYGGYLCGGEIKTITFEGEKILVDKEYMLRIPNEEEFLQDPSDYFNNMKKNELLEKISWLYLGEWEKEYDDYNVLDGIQWSVVIKFSSGEDFKSSGSNRFPYNFDNFLYLMGMSEKDTYN